MPSALVPLAAAILLACVQLVPLPNAVHRVLSPGTFQIHRDLVQPDILAAKTGLSPGALALPEIRPHSHRPVSLYPVSTRRDLSLLILATAVFALGALLFKTAQAQFYLCLALAINGAAFAFFGLVQQLSWNGMLYWRVPLQLGGAPFAAYVNRNHAGNLLNLCLAGSIAVAIWAILRRDHRDDDESTWHPVELSLLARLRHKGLCFIAQLDAPKLAALVLCGLIIAGVFCSLSRGAVVSMIGAGMLTLLVAGLACRVSTHSAWIGAGLLAGLGLVSWVGMTDMLKHRMATLLEAEPSGGRSQLWSDSIRAVPDFWPLGSGLGTYRYTYEPYERSDVRGWAYHAENLYLESLLDAGVAGLTLVLAMIVLVLASCWLLVRLGRDTRTFAFAIAATFALFTQILHASFDFALYMPANMITFALLAGAACGGAAVRWGKGLEQRQTSKDNRIQETVGKLSEQRAEQTKRMTLSSGTTEHLTENTAGVTVPTQTLRKRRRDRHNRRRIVKKSLLQRLWTASQQLVENLPPIASISDFAAERRMRSPRHRQVSFMTRWAQKVQMLPERSAAPVIVVVLLLAGCLFGLAETRDLALVRRALAQSNTSGSDQQLTSRLLLGKIALLEDALLEVPGDVEAQQRMTELWIKLYRVAQLERVDRQQVPVEMQDKLWTITSPALLHARIHQLVRQDQHEMLRQVRSDPLVTGPLTRALEHALLARHACPLPATTHLRIGELWPVAYEPSGDAVHLARARQLAPADAELQFRAGVLELQAGRVELALSSWNRSLSLSEEFLPKIVAAANQYLDVTAQADQLFPDSPALLIRLATDYYPAEKFPELHSRLTKRAEQLLKADLEAGATPDEGHYLLGEVLALQQQTGSAIESLERAVALQPAQQAWRYKLASLLRQQGRLEEAHEHAKRLARMSPQSAQYNELLREIHRAKLEQ